MPSNSDSRFRSFAERYVIERARNWPADGTERDRAWQAMLDAKSIYAQIAQVDKSADLDGAGQAGQPTVVFPTRPQQALNPGKGVTGPSQNGVQGIFSVRGIDAALLGAGDWLHEGPSAIAAAAKAYANSPCAFPAGLKNALAQLQNAPGPRPERWWNK